VRPSNAPSRRPARKTRRVSRSTARAAVAPIEDQIHRVFVAREEERCRRLEGEYARDPKKAGEKVTRRSVPRPWTRPVPQALLQDPDLLLLVTDFDYDIADTAFQEYCRSRGVLHVAGEEGSRRREFFSNHAKAKDDFLGDPHFHFAQPHDGKRYEYTPHEIDIAWQIVCLGRAALQDCWELYRQWAAARPSGAGTQGVPRVVTRTAAVAAKRTRVKAARATPGSDDKSKKSDNPKPKRKQKPQPKSGRATQMNLFHGDSPNARTVRRGGRRNRKR
jgi:hypothetical protein